jgi:phosphoheptose isomerase
MVGRFKKERAAWPVIAMTTDTSILTALSNDYSFNFVFARQIEALAQERDLLLGISTSGDSTNVLVAIEAAREKHVKTVSLLGRDGGQIASVSNIAVVVP